MRRSHRFLLLLALLFSFRSAPAATNLLSPDPAEPLSPTVAFSESDSAPLAADATAAAPADPATAPGESSSKDATSLAFLADPHAALAAGAIVGGETAPPPRFHWTPALLQAGEYLLIQHVAIFYMDSSKYDLSLARWWPNPFWPRYVKSVQGLYGWDDGDPFLDNYVGHPLQGAITSYIQIQNDDRGKRLRFGESADYWRSRLKALAFNATYSTMFELSPIGEAGIENLGMKRRSRLCQGGTERCRYSEMAWVDLVMTPAGGFGWLLMEDALDRYVAEAVERKTQNGFLRGVTRVAVNPGRAFANLLRVKTPWYRDRDAEVRVAFGDPAGIPGPQ